MAKNSRNRKQQDDETFGRLQHKIYAYDEKYETSMKLMLYFFTCRTRYEFCQVRHLNGISMRIGHPNTHIKFLYVILISTHNTNNDGESYSRRDVLWGGIRGARKFFAVGWMVHR